MALANPFAFRPAQVTFWTTVIYIALLAPSLWIHETVPTPPAESALPSPISLIEAWEDLGTLSDSYHPLNSRANDVVRDWVLLRIQDILDASREPWASEPAVGGSGGGGDAEVVVFNDVVSNVTYRDKVDTTTINRNANYFEGSNVYVYIRGLDDERGEWWKGAGADEAKMRSMRKKGVLVNAHIDSVATGFGATDNGVAVVSCLQLVKYFATPANRPRRGLVILFNNGEEDGLYGAHAFGNSPLNSFIGSFVNLDGAGAGGRATLFRSTDLEVTRAYASSPHPFGSVVGTDGYKAGWIRSDTDYHTFVDAFGYRGLDIAFYSPRALYHTAQDDRKHTSKASVWHMLSSALASAQELAGGTGDEVGEAMNNGVWFDLFGDSMVLFYLRGMFAWSLTVLIASPLVLMFLLYVVHKLDKDFIGKYSMKVGHDPDGEKVPVGGMRGFFRFPFALCVAGAFTFGAAFLVRKVQPFIVYSSPYAVWAMMLSLFYFAFWCIMKGADFARPSALHRIFVHLWLFVISWVLLVAVTVLEDRHQIASGYIFVFWSSQIFLSTLLCIFEFFGLPKKTAYARQVQEESDFQDHLHEVPHSDAIIAPDGDEHGDSAVHQDEEEDEPMPPTEHTPLVGGDRSSDNTRRTTFATGYRRSIAALVKSGRPNNASQPQNDDPAPYGDEQPWSASLPSTLWLLEFLLIGPFMIVLSTQLALLLTTALSQTGADGSDLLRPYLFISLFAILLLLPLTPFIHRVSHHVPLFLLAVFAGTLVYNLLSFPFSPKSPYKVYFRQEIDLDAIGNKVIYTGVEEYVRQVVAEMPSAYGQEIECVPAAGRRPRGLVDCSFDGSKVAPDVGGNVPPGIPPEKGYQGLVKLNITRPDEDDGGDENGTMMKSRKHRNSARFTIDATNSRTCTLSFAKPVADVRVQGGNGWDERFSGPAPDDGFYGVEEFDLWRRDWTTPWVVDVEWEDGEDASSLEAAGKEDGGKNDVDELRRRAQGLDGSVTCKWSDANNPRTIPALDEAVRYLPTWALVSKARVGLVEGTKSWMV